MPTLRSPRSSGHHRRAAPLTALGLAVVVTLAMTGGSAVPAAGEPDPRPSDAGPVPTATDTDTDTDGTYRVTLLTGDVVVYTVGADGTRSAWVEDETVGVSSRAHPARVYEQDDHIHVVPAEAEPFLTAGVLDPRLFDVTLLVEQGYHDAATNTLPLIVVAADGAATMSPADLPGTHQDRSLPSIDAVAVGADKEQIADTWAGLRGSSPAARATTAELGGAGSVWLNGRVEAALDDSAAQIGAPQAWEAGLDGTGVTVAVLDSGYDPTHPDLAEQVVEAKDFTDPDGAAVDGNGHGTHVASTIAGTGAASDGSYTGVAPGADLLVGRVLDSSGSGTEEQIIAGMEWAVAQGADVVNMSLGTSGATDGTDPMSLAVDALSAESGALFVVAAGNVGPYEYTVGSPGAATSALTIGAVDKADAIADFSSRGPRLGDDAIKPEIVGPGVGIVAARAAGTSLGNLLGQHYTALNGTSMATPHVAGAAAILAQQHPEWTGEQIKARLVSTALPLDDAPVSAQGSGRLDIGAAIAETIGVSDGVLTMRGAAGDEALTGTLTFSNPLDRSATVRLSGDLDSPGSDAAGRPVLRFRPSTLTIPAGGQATTTVTVAPDRNPGGSYTGHIVAQDVRDRDRPVRTAVSFALARPLHTLTVSGTDRNGEAGVTVFDVWNEDTGETRRVFGWDGVATTELPEGDYTLLAEVRTADGAGAAPGVTVAGRPEFRLDEDVDLAYDARDGEPLQVRTDRPTDLDRFHIVSARSVGNRSYSEHLTTGLTGEELSVLPGPEAREGTFTFATAWQLVEPLMTAEVTGPEGFVLSPSPQLPNLSAPYVGDTSLPIAYAGTGTPAELAAADVAGKVVVVSRRGDDQLDQQVNDAQAAGAAFVLGHHDQPGVWDEIAWNNDFPVYLVDQATGEGIRDALAADPTAELKVRAVRDHRYAYELTFSDPAVPSGRTYDTSDLDLAIVESDYHEPSDRIVGSEAWGALVGPDAIVMPHLSLNRRGPVQRTDYVATTDVLWSRYAQPHHYRGMYVTSTPHQAYVAGETTQREWWGPLVHPGTPLRPGIEEAGLPTARFQDAIRIFLRHYLYDDTLTGTIYEQMRDSSALTLRRNGEVVGTSTWPEAQFTVPPEVGDFELSLDVTNGPEHFADTSVRTSTTWGFRSGRADEERTVLPLVQAEYHLETGPYNDVPAGLAHPLVIDPGYQPGASGPGGFTATVDVSYDDGVTWSSAPVDETGERFSATVPAAATDGFATVRLELIDADGNRLTQQIDRAWKVTAAE